MKNKTLKTFLIIISALALILVLGYLGICAQAYYMNMNPDHVDLKNGGWVKLMHFITDTRMDKRKTLVEMYGRSARELNSGEFIIVRPGILPLGILSISPIYDVDHLWTKERTYNNEHGDSITGSIQVFHIFLGYRFGKQAQIIKFRSVPSMSFSFYCKYGSNEYVFSGICYINCDIIPIINFPKSQFNEPIFSEKRTGIYLDCDIKKYFPYVEEKLKNVWGEDLTY